jgi:hypothetical protein
MLRQHFRDLHPFNKVVVSTEGYFPRCERCAMQVNPAYPRHIWMQECQTGVERKLQRDSAVHLALALRTSSRSTGTCWNALRYLNTSVACLRRMTTMHKLFGNSCKKHGEYGLVWGKCYAGKTLPQGLLLNFTKQ